MAVEKKPEAIDPWDILVDVHPERGDRSESPTIFVSLNNKGYYVPKGKSSKVPYPIYLRLRLLQKAQDEELKLWREMHDQNVDLTK